MKMKWWQIGLLFCLLLVALSPLASSAPDGLERVAEDKGFMEKVTAASFALIPDYLLPGIENEVAATILAGVLGTLIVFALVWSLARLVQSRQKTIR